MSYDNRTIAYAFFGDISDIKVGEKIPCKACGRSITKPRSGYSSIVSHVDAHHLEVKESTAMKYKKQVVKNKGPIDAFVPFRSVTKFTLKLFSWVEWVVMGDLPLSWCENKWARKYTNISGDGRSDGLSRKTLSKYIDLLFKELKKRMSKELPKTFGIIFDGWSCDREHYLANFAIWSNQSGGVVTRLLSCGVQDLPEDGQDASTFGFGANDLGDYMQDFLTCYGHSYASIEFLAGDNCSVNQALARKLSNFTQLIIPLVGCASHKLNLATQMLYEGVDAPYYSIVRKVNLLSIELRTLKNSYKLNHKTALAPVKRNDTRWGSVHSMLRRYLQLHDILPTCAFERSVLLMIPTAAEKEEIEELLEKLKNIEEVSKFLQHEDTTKVNLAQVRAAFDTLISDYPIMKHHLAAGADIIYDKNFDSAVVKVQRGNESALTTAEKATIARYKLDTATAITIEAADVEKVSYMDKVRANGMLKRAKTTTYKCMNHISATSNVVERLFSRAKHIMTDERRCMDPSTLEAILFLKYNRDMWDIHVLDSLVSGDVVDIPAFNVFNDNNHNLNADESDEYNSLHTSSVTTPIHNVEEEENEN